MNKDLRDFLAAVKEAGKEFYVETKKPVSTRFETCVVQEKLGKEKRFPVVYFPQIQGNSFPLVSNVFASYELQGLAMGLNPRSATKAEILHEYRKRIRNLIRPRLVPASEAPVKNVVLKNDDIDLGLLPIIHHAPLDSGRYITIGSTICRHPETGIPNVGIYRLEVKGKAQLGCMINPINHGSYIARRYAELGKPMEVVIFIGHHPAVILGSTAKGSLGMNELEVMGGLLGEPLEVTQAETVDLPVPASAEIVIEGVIDPRTLSTDGPFAEFAGYYGEAGKPCYTIQVTAITMRKDPIYHDLDPAHQEHNLARVLASEASTFDIIQSVLPSVKAVHFPISGTCTFHAYISINKRVQGEGVLAAMAAFCARPSLKLAIVVDEDVDVYDEREVLWAVATRVEGDTNITMIPRMVGAHLNPTAYDETRLKRGPMSTHTLIDATKPIGLPFAKRIIPSPDVWNAIDLNDYFK